MSVDEQEDSAQTTPYQEAGALAGITRLVDEFYINMDTLPEAETIRSMHPPDLTESRKNNAGRKRCNSDKSPQVFRTIGRDFVGAPKARRPAGN